MDLATGELILRDMCHRVACNIPGVGKVSGWLLTSCGERDKFRLDIGEDLGPREKSFGKEARLDDAGTPNDISGNIGNQYAGLADPFLS